MKNKPVAQQVYSYKEILDLDLRDIPFLFIWHDDAEAVVQLSHLHIEELLKNEKWANSQWRYIRETHEWIPIFKFVGNDYKDLVEIEPCAYSHWSEKEFWVTPKGFPREQ